MICFFRSTTSRLIVESSQTKVSPNHFGSVPPISVNSVSSRNRGRMLLCSKLYLVRFLHITGAGRYTIDFSELTAIHPPLLPRANLT